jgi:type IV pilus assembly protein PilM
VTRQGKKPGARALTCQDGHSVGIDIGATAVRAAVLNVQVKDGVPTVTTQHLGGVPLHPGTVVNGVVTDPASLTAALKTLWRANDISCRNVIVGVANPQVLVREIQIPHLEPAQQARALPFQARDVIALPMDQVVLDFTPLGPPDPDTNMVTGLLVASPRQPVLSAVSAVERAGLKVARVDLSSFAVLRSSADDDFDVEAVIDLGAHLTTVVVHQRGIPKLVRTLPRGGEELTAHLAERLGISAEEAEEAKRTSGLGLEGEVSTLLDDFVGPLLSEIRSSINYFRTGHSGALLGAISLTGGGAALPGLAEVLSKQNGAPASVSNPLRLVGPAIKGKSKTSDDRWASALSVGLAMGTAA